MILIKKQYIEDILSGKKTQTIRKYYNGKINSFDYFKCGNITINIKINNIIDKKIEDLSDNDAKLDGFNSKKSLIETLNTYYPGIKYIKLIQFTIVN